MANWRKKGEQWERRVAVEAARWVAMSKAEREAYRQHLNQGTDAANDGYVTDDRTFDDMAREVMAREPDTSLQWALAHALLHEEAWCGLDDAVLGEQARQHKMRQKYGETWPARVKLRAFAEWGDEGKNTRAWRVVRWLEKRGFVTVGDGFVTWVGPTK